MQPVPWVWRLSRRSAVKRYSEVPSVSRSTGGPGRWPPLISAHVGPSSSTASAARRSPSSSSTFTEVSCSTSHRLGVTTVATGSSRVRSVSTASGTSSVSPCLDTPTGSTITGAE